MREYLKMVWRDLCHDEFRDESSRVLIFTANAVVFVIVEVVDFLLRVKKGEHVF